VVVLWVGTNNHGHTAKQICGGIIDMEAVSSLSHASLLNVDPGFVHSDGSISHQDLYDYLHLTPQGYQAVCQPLHTHLKGLLEKQAKDQLMEN
ncbi:unnamed protein product, partial [Coregonus sp. 'balchen']